MKKFKKAIVLTSILLLGTLNVGCGNKVADTQGNVEAKTEEKVEPTVIKLGVNGTEFRVWDYVGDELKKENIKLEIVSFADYVQPNLALDQGEINANAFQTLIYFESFKKEHNLDLVSIGNTTFAPMGVYSNKLKDINDIQEGGQIAIPNDVTNGGRALLLLEEAGLIKLNDGVALTPKVADIKENPKNITIIQMVAGQIPRSLQDLDAAVINNGVAVTAGMNPINDTIYLEQKDSDKAFNYYNIIAVRKEDEKNPALLKLVEIYQTEKVKELIKEIYGEGVIPVF